MGKHHQHEAPSTGTFYEHNPLFCVVLVSVIVKSMQQWQRMMLKVRKGSRYLVFVTRKE